jgi:hypothetical protein
MATAFMLFASGGSATAKHGLVVPPDAYEMVKTHGCDQVSDFYDNRPGAEGPPYALINGDRGKKQIAVWCTREASKPEPKRTYLLLLRIDDIENPLSRCPNEIHGIQHIGGLRFIDIEADFSAFYYLETKKPVKKTGKLHTKGISSEYDGVGERYVCVDGRWAFSAFD